MAERLGVRQCRRPVTPGSSDRFDLAYVRSAVNAERSEGPPVLMVPGGPGLGSIVPFVRLREEARRRGLDVVMVEHRGVGFSRHTGDGRDLPPEAMTLTQAADDLAAVLDDAGIEQVVVYGTSYGSYLAQLFGARHPGRIAAMVLDAPVVRAGDHDRRRTHLRSLLWHGETSETRRAAELLRACIAQGRLDPATATTVVQPVYEFGGPATLERLLALRLDGRGERLWAHITEMATQEITENAPPVSEFDLVGRIAFRELGFAPVPDGEPLDVDLPMVEAAPRFEPFAGEPVDLVAALADVRWPVTVVRGERDLRSPPAVARQIEAGVPDAVSVTLPDTGHSAMDTHPLAALHVAHAAQVGGQRRLPALAPRIAALPRPAAVRAPAALLRTSIALHRLRRASRS
ncbi:MAG: alpha/beta fold hydrolase [Nitriliruptoraceae bacterium]|nr:alpha/beta fold hydrolase [Nitriliruptoraceae bacterium]